jgi:hypothetical protein
VADRKARVSEDDPAIAVIAEAAEYGHLTLKFASHYKSKTLSPVLILPNTTCEADSISFKVRDLDVRDCGALDELIVSLFIPFIIHDSCLWSSSFVSWQTSPVFCQTAPVMQFIQFRQSAAIVLQSPTHQVFLIYFRHAAKAFGDCRPSGAGFGLDVFVCYRFEASMTRPRSPWMRSCRRCCAALWS